MAKRLGATHLINYVTTPDWDAEVSRITGGKHTKHQCMIFSVGSHEKAKCIDGRLAPHISSTIPQKSSRLPKDAADGERFHVTWQLRNSFVSFSVDGL
jgi:NADPH:quinone reductase-like Zn-dependent oxidoreductase